MKYAVGQVCEHGRLRRSCSECDMQKEIQQAGELLAVIHGDGGHYVCQHGWEKACADAREKFLRLWAENEELRAKAK